LGSSSSQMASMGIMNEGYFVGRKELTQWIRDNFEPSFQKVEDLASGVVYCQILNTVHPGSVQMSKVKMAAKTEVDYLHNFKCLQAGFNRKKISQRIEVEKLTKRSFQFNMEFVQFMKCYADMHLGSATAPPPSAEAKENSLPSRPAAAPAPTPAAKRAPPPRDVVSSGARRVGAGAGQQAGKAAAAPQQAGKAAAAPPQPPASAGPSPCEVEAAAEAAEAAAAELCKAREEHSREAAELRVAVENLERERDFYFGKLREVEVLCQTKEASSPLGEKETVTVAEVLSILYKTDESEEFQPPPAEPQ